MSNFPDLIAEAYNTIYENPEPITFAESDLMLDLVSRITSTFTAYYPMYSQIQENTVRYICDNWSKGKVDKPLFERTLNRARIQNNKSVNNLLTYLESGVYDNELKNFVKENILKSLS